MSVQSTIAVLKAKLKYPTIGSIVLDAMVEELHTQSMEITSHNIEDGADITDHVRRLPLILQIRGVISNTPISFPNILPGVALVTSGINLIQGVSNDFAVTQYQAFLDMINAKEQVIIATSLKTYGSMILENLEVVRNAENSDCLNFTCTAKEVNIVTTSILGLTAIVQGGVQTGKKALGKKATQPLNTPTETKANNKGSTLFNTLVGG